MKRFAFALLLCAPVIAAADDQDVIDYRQHVMKTLGEQMAAIGMILENRAPAGNLPVHLQVLAVTAPQAAIAFEPAVQGGNAKPEVWTNNADFKARLEKLVSATATLAAAGKGGDAAAIASQLSTLDCKGCHDTYRVPPK